MEDSKIHGLLDVLQKSKVEEEGDWGAHDDKCNTSQHKLLPAQCEVTKASESKRRRESAVDLSLENSLTAPNTCRIEL